MKHANKNMSFDKTLKMMTETKMIEMLKQRSFPIVVEALVALNRIQYRPAFKSEKGTGSGHLVFNPYGDVWVTLCYNGDLCNKPKCPFHHLNRDYFFISRDYVRCSKERNAETGECSYSSRCYFRHEEACARAIARDLADDSAVRAQKLEEAKFILQRVFEYYSRTGDTKGLTIAGDEEFIALASRRYYPYF